MSIQLNHSQPSSHLDFQVSQFFQFSRPLTPDHASKRNVTLQPLQISSTKGSHNLIGNLTLEERRKKIELYMQKKRNRNYEKKVSYDCRKKIAQRRSRVKGRFIKREQQERLKTGQLLQHSSSSQSV